MPVNIFKVSIINLIILVHESSIFVKARELCKKLGYSAGSNVTRKNFPYERKWLRDFKTRSRKIKYNSIFISLEGAFYLIKKSKFTYLHKIEMIKELFDMQSQLKNIIHINCIEMPTFENELPSPVPPINSGENELDDIKMEICSNENIVSNTNISNVKAMFDSILEANSNREENIVSTLKANMEAILEALNDFNVDTRDEDYILIKNMVHDVLFHHKKATEIAEKLYNKLIYGKNE